MVRVRAELNPGIAEMHAILSQLPAEAADDALQAVDAKFRQHEKRVFDTEGEEGGPKWEKLSVTYKARKDRLFGQARTTIRSIAKARGERVGSYKRRLGAENKILQLTGDGKRAFSEQGGFHIAWAFKRGANWILELGASGPKYMEYHAEGDGQKLRPPIQLKHSHMMDFLKASNRRLIPHILRRIRERMAWRQIRGLR